MATIDSVELYLSSNRTGWNIHVDIHDVSASTSNPTIGDVLGSKVLAVDSVPNNGSQDWVVFTFDTPINIVSNGFYAIHVWANTNDYQAGGLYWYHSDDFQAVELPYAGDEQFQYWTGATWQQTSSGAYRINCTDCDDNQGESPLGTFNTFDGGSSCGHGVRSYLAPAGEAPIKPTNPTPENTDTEVDWSAKELSWDDGGGADTYNVYFGLTGALEQISSAQAETSIIVDVGDIPYPEEGESGAVFYWRVDATNDGGTTTGDEWHFDARPGKATNPTPTDDEEGIRIVGSERITKLQWVAPEDQTPGYLVYFKLPDGDWLFRGEITDDTTEHTLTTAMQDLLDYFSIYSWRIDTTNICGITTGDTWTFISQYEGEQWTSFPRRSDYNVDKIWQPGTGWVDIDDFEYTGGGRFKNRVLVIGHKVLYFGSI